MLNKLILGTVSSYKTKDLINYSLEKNIPILALTKQKESSLIEKSLAYFGKIVSVIDLESAKTFDGKILVDDLDKSFTTLLNMVTGNDKLVLDGAVLSTSD
jgi:hypothetical protein